MFSSSRIPVISEGISCKFPLTTDLIKFSPWPSRISFPIGDNIYLVNALAPAKFLTVLGIMNEKHIGSLTTVWHSQLLMYPRTL
jgi:hypothetical protein